MPQAMKIPAAPAAKAAVVKEWEKIGEDFGVELDKSQKQETSDRGSKDVGRYSSFCNINGHLSFEKC